MEFIEPIIHEKIKLIMAAHVTNSTSLRDLFGEQGDYKQFLISHDITPDDEKKINEYLLYINGLRPDKKESQKNLSALKNSFTQNSFKQNPVKTRASSTIRDSNRVNPIRRTRFSGRPRVYYNKGGKYNNTKKKKKKKKKRLSHKNKYR